MAKKVELGSRSNVCDLMELVNVVETTQCSSPPSTWYKLMYRAIYYHPGPVDERADFVFSDPLKRRNIDQHNATIRASTKCVVSEYMSFSWCHEEKDIERTPHDQSRDLNGYVRMNDSLPWMPKAPNKPYDASGSSSDPNEKVPSTT